MDGDGLRDFQVEIAGAQILTVGGFVSTAMALAGGAGADVLRGGVMGDTLAGLAGADSPAGNAGDDSLAGGDEADTLSGGDGADKMAGGAGKDLPQGNAGADRFVFTIVGDSPPTTTARDVIGNWGAGDRIDVSAIDANTTIAGNQAFVFKGVTTNTGAAAAAELWVYQYGGNTYVIAGVDADGVRDFQVEISNQHSLTVADFVL